MPMSPSAATHWAGVLPSSMMRGREVIVLPHALADRHEAAPIGQPRWGPGSPPKAPQRARSDQQDDGEAGKGDDAGGERGPGGILAGEAVAGHHASAFGVTARGAAGNSASCGE